MGIKTHTPNTLDQQLNYCAWLSLFFCIASNLEHVLAYKFSASV